MTPEVIVHTREQLVGIAVQIIEQEARRARWARRRFSLALAGGSVAQVTFEHLATAALPWAQTDIFWADERAVPATDRESNYGAAKRLLLDPAGIPAASIHPMPADTADLQLAAKAYEKELLGALGAPPEIDVALLGVGLDGHVASLFPGHPLLAEQNRWVAAVTDSPKPPPRRLTLTLGALCAARLVLVAAFGSAKAEAVRRLLETASSEVPLALLARGATRMFVLLDEESGRNPRLRNN